MVINYDMAKTIEGAYYTFAFYLSFFFRVAE